MVAPPDGRGGWDAPTRPQATTPAASFQTFMDDVTEVLNMIDKVPGGFNTPQMASAFRPSIKRTRARDDPVIAALLKELQDEHDLAVAMHEYDHGAPLACNAGSPTSLPNPGPTVCFPDSLADALKLA